MDIPFQIFGSADSKDTDVIVFVTEIPATIKESADLCGQYGLKLVDFFQKQNLPDKAVNVNLAIVREGIITKTFKGIADETNNACYYTYGLFNQYFPIQISQTVTRNKALKLLRCMRSVLSVLSRTQYRTDVKASLSSNFAEQTAVLRTIEWDKLDLAKTSMSEQDLFKMVAFQAGQTIALYDKKELYTKQSVIDYLPETKYFIDRNIAQYDFQHLITIIKKLLLICEQEMPALGQFNEETYIP